MTMEGAAEGGSSNRIWTWSASPVELYQISPETLLYQIFRMNLKKVHDPGTDDLPPVFDYKNGMVCKTAYRVCPPAINSFLF